VALFSQGKYEESEALLRTLTSNYPQTGYMPAALFWLGNSLYASGELKRALEVENKLLKEFPKDARVPDALLTKAAAEVGLGQRTNATKTLQKIIKEHKDAPAAKVAQERLKSLSNKKKK
jgi:tol-pal system protein YbgF